MERQSRQWSKLALCLCISYAVALHLLVALLLAKTDFISRASRALGFVAHSSKEPTEFYYQTVPCHQRMDDNVPAGAVVFIGDSLTQGLCVAAVSPLSVNYGVGTDTTVGVLGRLPFYRSLSRASAVVVAVGLNDLGRRGNGEILRNYGAIIAAMPATLPVVCSAVLPVDERSAAAPGLDNRRIAAVNAGIQRICDASPRLVYVDAGRSLLDSTGDLDRKFHDGDGVHLNAEGNAIWIRHLSYALARVWGVKQSSLPRARTDAIPLSTTVPRNTLPQKRPATAATKTAW